MIPTNDNDPLSEFPSCKNCGSPHWSGEKHCADCGQKVFTGPPTIWKLFADFFESLFNIDNRVFRTLRNLVIPGKLTTQYLAGRQKPFLNPLKFFFISTVLMLASAAILVTYKVEDLFNREALSSRMDGYRSAFKEELNIAIDSIQASYPEQTVETATDSLSNLITDSESDSVSLIHFNYDGGAMFKGEIVKFASKDIYTLSPTEIVDKYEIEGWFNRLQLKQVIRIDTMDSQVIPSLFGLLVWGLMFIVPFCAILLKLFYIRRNRLLVEHVIFTLHVHTFLFLALASGFIVFYFFDVPYGIIFAGIAIVFYFPLALRRVYRQSWIKTLFKMCFLFVGYTIAVTFCGLISTAIAVVMY